MMRKLDIHRGDIEIAEEKSPHRLAGMTRRMYTLQGLSFFVRFFSTSSTSSTSSASSAFLLCVFFVSLFVAPSIFARSVYTDLTDPAQVKIFDDVSDSLVCLCGCHFVLSSCPHTECPFAIPVRRFIESRIREGMTASEITEKMEYGFGPAFRNDPQIIDLGRRGRNDLVKGFIDGFDHEVSSHSSPIIPVLLILVFSAGAFWLLLRWRRRRVASGESVPEKDADKNKPGVDVKDRFRDMDR